MCWTSCKGITYSIVSAVTGASKSSKSLKRLSYWIHWVAQWIIILKSAIRFDGLPLLQQLVTGWTLHDDTVDRFFESAKNDWVAPLKVHPAGAWDRDLKSVVNVLSSPRSQRRTGSSTRGPNLPYMVSPFLRFLSASANCLSSQTCRAKPLRVGGWQAAFQLMLVSDLACRPARGLATSLWELRQSANTEACLLS